MAPKKFWRPVKEWVSHEWATMKEAWRRVHASLSEDAVLTRREVKADLLARRLVGAARVVNKKEGTEHFIVFERDFWKPVEFPYAWNVTGYDEHYREGEEWHFFVRRRELDKRYPAAANATPSERPADSLFQEMTIPRHPAAFQPPTVASSGVLRGEPQAHDESARRDPPEYSKIRQRANELHPEGYDHIKTKVLIDEVYKALGRDAPKSREVGERALHRRERKRKR